MKLISNLKLNRLWIMLLGLLLGSWSFSQAQTAICEGDSICLDAGIFRGSIQWQDSPDGITFTDIAGFNTSPHCDVPPVGQLWIRGAITEGTCDTFYTDTMSLYVSPSISAAFADSILIIPSCAGSISLGDSLQITGGTAPFSYLWTPAANLSSDSVANPLFTAMAPGIDSFNVVITDSVGCEAAAMIAVEISAAGQDSFNYTGGIQTFTVPGCVDTIFIETWGAQGGTGALGGNSSIGGEGGLGGYASGYLAVSSGTILNIFVGGEGAVQVGGFNGGANGGSVNAGGGGGASDVRIGGTALGNRILTAGGGGGGGRGGCESNAVNGGDGGAGGGGAGLDGTTSPNGGGGFGGTVNNGGLAGVGCSGFLGSAGMVGASGVGGTGGAGQSCCCFGSPSIPGGGGGGGGDLGGSGGGGGSAGTTGCSGNDKGGGGGGAGGTSNASLVINGNTTQGVRTGQGMVRISW